MFDLWDKAPERVRQMIAGRNTAITSEEYRQKHIQVMNNEIGSLTGYDCPKCKNKGVIYTLDGAYEVAVPCDCMAIRESIQRIKSSGLENLLQECTFDTYQTDEEWQRRIKQDAMEFVEDHDRKWFFIGGQVGAGKTHICTAIVGAFLDRGYRCKYMLWRDEAVKLKAVANDDFEYSKAITPLKTVPVLYIDDFFKTSKGEDRKKRLPTQGDINVAFEIINYRYINNCITILSSEWTVDELLTCDEATGSRIYQRTKDHHWDIGENRSRNYRLK